MRFWSALRIFSLLGFVCIVGLTCSFESGSPMRLLNSTRARDALIIALMFFLPLLTFWSQTVGGKTLIPAENLYQFEPYATAREAVGAPLVQQNHLVLDLALQNYQWKSFIRESIAEGEVPLWNPHQFSGIAFFAAGQQSTLYPFNVLYYVLPLWLAYGWFTVIQLWLAGVFMYAFTRGLGVSQFGAAFAGITYQLSAFFIISAVFPMIIASVVWLPLMLLMIEFMLKRRDKTLIWLSIGAVALGCNILAGHVEITYYTLIIAGYYAAGRLLMELSRTRTIKPLIAPACAMLAMVALGLGLGATQFLPLFEAAQNNFRTASTTFDQVLGWAHKPRDIVQFLLPNFYGNPSHHAIFDIFSFENVPMSVNALGETRYHTEWGLKNYVEAALYVGVLPLAFAAFALLARGYRTAEKLIWGILGVFSLTVMFGLPTYGILYFTLPGIDQLHSPFRWVFGLTVSVAVLAGFGVDRFVAHRGRLTQIFAYGITGIGTLTLIGLLASRLFYGQVAPLVERVFNSMALATSGFPDAQSFYSYQFVNVLIFGVVALVGGITLLALRRLQSESLKGWHVLTVAILAADLMIASGGFNPASDPAWLEYTPPSIAWLQAQDGEWRYTALETVGRPAIMNANSGLRYQIDDIRGYESIIPKPYVEFMERTYPQPQLEFNRVAPLYTHDDYASTLESAQLNLLNLRYVITYADQDLTATGWTVAYQDDAVRIYENENVRPRAFVIEASEALTADAPYTPAAITPLNSREMLVDVDADAGDWAIISLSYDAGWRAFIRPQGGDEDAESALETTIVLENLLGAQLPDAGAWTIRFVYSPQSFQVGLFASFVSVIILVLMLGMWGWRRFVNTGDTPTGGGVKTVAKNSLAPILLNLFNRGVDMAFALVMLRVLGAEDAGLYFYAGIVFVWFDIFTNFGLNLYLTRAVSRDRSSAAYMLLNTSALRFVLMILGIPLLVGFLVVRQGSGDPLPDYAVLSIAILYIGLFPNSLSNGLSALYYAFEKAEIPAATATIATILKTVGGLAALLIGWGIVGLAAVSIITNTITLMLLWWNSPLRKREIRAEAKAGTNAGMKAGTIDRPMIRRMVGESYPLMLNHFLAQIFFQVDVILIEWIHNPTMVGQYSVAYKWISAINVIPAFFTQALLPLMSRQAHEDRAALKRNVTMGLKLLSCITFPLAVVFTFAAYPLAGFLGGAQYLPDGAIATQLMIWSIPFGWMNSLVQYVLIALDLQNRISRAFMIAVGFNIAANLLLVPEYGYQAAAITTILSELILLVGFTFLLRGSIGMINWVNIMWKPLAAALVMGAVLVLAYDSMPFAALVFASALYLAALFILRPLNADERARLAPLIPSRVRRLVMRTA